MSDKQAPEIRVIKRKKGHAPHHGGAWKVAYADFVTAMMAFFLVMWIIGLSNEVKQSIAGYFDDPIGFMKAVRAGNSPFSVSELGARGSSEDKGIGKDSKERKKMAHAKQIIEKVILKAPTFRNMKQSVTVKLTDSGLRIDLVESRQSLFFDSGSAHITPESGKLLRLLAAELKKLPNPIMFEGHTDSRRLARSDGYSNWELSSDRANAARKMLVSAGYPEEQVSEVRGFADNRLRDPDNPDSMVNRRVSIVVLLSQPKDNSQTDLKPPVSVKKI
ncbi:MAG: flagellar motor protein MotB [Armatimonadota bacterium]